METHILLFFAAIVAGAINAIAGGGGLITFPLLMTVLSPVTADATSSLALLPGYAASTWAGRDKLPRMRYWWWLLLAPSLLGGLTGALLLTWTGNRSFVVLVPWLVFGATMLILLRPYLSHLRSNAEPLNETLPSDETLPSIRQQIGAAVLMFFVAIYGGYFGSGIGILVLGIFGLIGLSDVHGSLALKNALAGSLRTVAVLVFLVKGDVNWEYGLSMAVGAFFGGYLGGFFGRWAKKEIVRGGVITLGLSTSALYFWHAYGNNIEAIASD